MINSTSVYLISDQSNNIRGALYQVKDSSIVVYHSTNLTDYMEGGSHASEIDIIDIQLIKTSSRIKRKKGILIGAASGFVALGLIGIMSNGSGEYGIEFFNDSQIFFAAGVIGIPIGAFAGGMIGSFTIKIPIKGSMDNYNRNKKKLKRYSIKK